MKGKACQFGLICPAKMSFKQKWWSKDIFRHTKAWKNSLKSYKPFFRQKEIKNEIKKKLYAQQYKIDSHVTYTKLTQNRSKTKGKSYNYKIVERKHDYES